MDAAVAELRRLAAGARRRRPFNIEAWEPIPPPPRSTAGSTAPCA